MMAYSCLSSFEKLAMIASQHYEQNYGSENSFSENKKASRKRHTSSDTWTFQDFKALSPKALMDRFAKFTSDEINRKYYYQCRLLPGKCTTTEWSFGNEQKAWNRMKVHLIAHLEDESFELDRRVFAKSPPLECMSNSSNSVQKPLKVPAKPKFVSETESSSENDSQASSDCFKSKKMLEFGFDSGSTAKRKQSMPKHKSVQYNGWSLPVFSPLPTFHEKPLPLQPDDAIQPPVDEYTAQSSVSCKLDHNYFTLNPFPLSTRSMFTEQEPEIPVSVKKRPAIQEQFIIKTPKFPYLHVVEEYVVSEIVEIDWYGNIVKRRKRLETNCLDIKKYVLSKTREEKSRLRTPNGFELLRACGTQDVTGSVLECVENKVSKKSMAACAPKISYSSSDNDENSENVKRVKKELALKHINQLLNSKKKKHFNLPRTCQLCADGREFTAVASLIQHYRSHAGIKLYVCDRCPDTFTRQHSLNYHKMIHDNRSRFSCEFCTKRFRHPSHFKEHIRRHTGETPYQCAICEMLFKTRNTYKRHVTIQHNKILTARGIVDRPDEAPTCSKKLKKPQ